MVEREADLRHRQLVEPTERSDDVELDQVVERQAAKPRPGWRNEPRAPGGPALYRAIEGCPPPRFDLVGESVTCILPAHPRHAAMAHLVRGNPGTVEPRVQQLTRVLDETQDLKAFIRALTAFVRECGALVPPDVASPVQLYVRAPDIVASAYIGHERENARFRRDWGGFVVTRPTWADDLRLLAEGGEARQFDFEVEVNRLMAEFVTWLGQNPS